MGGLHRRRCAAIGAPEWEALSAPTGVESLWELSPQNMVAGGDDPGGTTMVWRWTGTAWSPMSPALGVGTAIHDVWGLPATGASAARLYWESFAKFGDGEVSIPAGASAFPKEIIPAPRKWAERRYTNLVYWNDLPKGGHFAAWEQPELFANELRACFGRMI